LAILLITAIFFDARFVATIVRYINKKIVVNIL